MQVIGGTYREIDFDGSPHNIFGSGLRSVRFILENSNHTVKYYTVGNTETRQHLENYKGIYKNFEYEISEVNEILTFKYYFALDEPRILPDPRTLKILPQFGVTGQNTICFGMLDGSYKVSGAKVVYDPQTAIEPVLFSSFGTAKELIYIVNKTEAKFISDSDDDKGILDFFFDKEKSRALIVKNGPYGAKLYINKNECHNIPSYRTDRVSKIGSGDIFTSAFAHFWFEQNDKDLVQCAVNASKVTANFCNSEAYNIQALEGVSFSPLSFKEGELIDKQVYIAAPIFSISDVILVDKVREALLGFGVKVFSPYHDIGYGDDKKIAEADLRGLEESDIVFSILDGLDSGTLIELGHLIHSKKKIIAYHRTVERGSLLMLETANIEYFHDLTTSLYHVIWNL